MRLHRERRAIVGVAAVGVAGVGAGRLVGARPAPEDSARRVVAPIRVVHRDRGKVYTLILVPVSINGHGPYPFLLDTGCPDVTVASDVAARAGVRSTPSREWAAAFGATGAVSAGTAGSVSVGGATVAGVPVDVEDFASYRAAQDSHYDGILGYDFMRHFRVTLDFARGRLVLEQP